MLDRVYRPQGVEARLYKEWEAAGVFRAGRDVPSSFCCILPPPNVTGSLHMGHALNTAIQDLLCRFERMRGKDVLWQPGMDHAGIATQMVVERQMEQGGGPGRRELGRAGFLERVWEWREQSGGMISQQLRRLGASCDWSRERFTMDEAVSRAVVKAFVSLYRDGLIYKDRRLVNWDSKLLTAVSDLEVEQVESPGRLWYFRYPVEGDSGRFLLVATTRPETICGDVAVAVNPRDERYADLVGAFVTLPLVGRRIPIIADRHADPEKGSGAVKITPAHDFDDFEVGERHELDPINILDRHARLVLKGNEDFLRGCYPSPEVMALHGHDRVEARARVVELMERGGFLERVEDHAHAVPISDRSRDVIEPRLTEQWYVDAPALAGPALESVVEGRTAFVPKSWERTYFDWLNDIRPWCVSRQLWWGHRIPAWYGPDSRLDGEGRLRCAPKIFVAENEEEVLACARDFYPAGCQIVLSESMGGYGYPVWGEDEDGTNGRVILYRDPDVLDTWFSSSLWPFVTLGWPDDTADLRRFYPTDILVTGFDIIFFWVARMMMMGLTFMKEVPFKTVYVHALVRDGRGRKMSKSKGNVVDPVQLIDKYGADVLRFALIAMAAQGQDIKLAERRVEGYRNFATKLWNAGRFLEMNACILPERFDPDSCRTVVGRWIVGEVAHTAAAVTRGIESHRYNESADALYHFIWHVFCDWHLELSKSTLSGKDEAGKAEIRAVTGWVFDRILRLLHPFMPFITEELWQKLGGAGQSRSSMLALSFWPQFSHPDDKEAGEEMRWVIDLIAKVRSVRAVLGVPAGVMIPMMLVGATEAVQMRVRSHEEAIQRLARVSGVEFLDEVVGGTVRFVVGGTVVALRLSGIVDFSAEKKRLEQEILRVRTEINKIDIRMSDKAFLGRAPGYVVEEQCRRRAAADEERCKLDEALQQVMRAMSR